MKKFLCAVMAAVVFCIGAVAPASADTGKEKVILSADVVDLFDDGVAMLMLAKSPKVELLGVAVVIGNTWVETGTASAIRQLEGIKRTDIPVLMGVNKVHREGRIAAIQDEKTMFGRGPDTHDGAAGYPQPKSWKDAYREAYKSEPTIEPSKEDAVDFIIRQVKANPNEVTIVAIGTYNNLAAAVQKAPEIVPLIKRVVYMGGAFFWNGNVTPQAEFNIWFDPEAAQIAWHSPFKEQVIFPLDACEKIKFTKKTYDELAARLKQPHFQSMFANHWTTPRFKENPEWNTFVWDILCAAYVIDPSIIEVEETLPVDVNTVYSPNYGSTLAYRGIPPDGTQKARIVFKVNEEKVWKQVNDLFDTM